MSRHAFPSGSIGFAAPGDPRIPVCVQCDTKVVLTDIPFTMQATYGIGSEVETIFAQRETGLYRDGLRLKDGRFVSLQDLQPGVGAYIPSLLERQAQRGSALPKSSTDDQAVMLPSSRHALRDARTFEAASAGEPRRATWPMVGMTSGWRACPGASLQDRAAPGRCALQAAQSASATLAFPCISFSGSSHFKGLRRIGRGASPSPRSRSRVPGQPGAETEGLGPRRLRGEAAVVRVCERRSEGAGGGGGEGGGGGGEGSTFSSSGSGCGSGVGPYFSRLASARRLILSNSF